jgi:hypothetical protein
MMKKGKKKERKQCDTVAKLYQNNLEGEKHRVSSWKNNLLSRLPHELNRQFQLNSPSYSVACVVSDVNSNNIQVNVHASMELFNTRRAVALTRTRPKKVKTKFDDTRLLIAAVGALYK